MQSQSIADAKAFNSLKGYIAEYRADGRTESAAFLLWFLQIIYRLDEVEAQDAVCDQSYDMGVDAVIVEDDQQEIVLLQGKCKEKFPSTIGDTDLREFMGTLARFATEETINQMVNSLMIGSELKRLLIKHEVAAKIGQQGYKIRPIFIANVPIDDIGRAYIETLQAQNAAPDIWDLRYLAPVLEQLSTEWFVSEPFELHLAANKFFVDGPTDDPRMVFSAVPALDLVRLPGIGDTRLFAQNVRLSLGKTRVNKEIEDSVAKVGGHADFLTFHNGLTVVAKNIKISGDTLTMSDYSVCNGCQSLVIFHNNADKLTPNLEIIVRFVRVGSDRALAASIAHRTNNQNPVSLRDQSANDLVQVQLKNEFDGNFGDETIYDIKRDNLAVAQELSNEVAGQLLLAFYNGQPWAAHQKYRVFGELYGVIFRYGVTSAHIRLAQLLMAEVDVAIEDISNERIRKYGLTRFVVLYLLGEVLRQEGDGAKLLQDPLPYLRVRGGKGNIRQNAVLDQVKQIAREIVTDVDFHLDSEGDAYDYKSEFKSERGVKSILSEVLKSYRKEKYRARATVFKLPA